FLLFPLLPAALRWRWRGTFLTAVAVGTALVAIPLLDDDPRFELNAVILRLVYVAMLTTVLGSMSMYEEQSREAIAKLVTWTSSGAADEDEFHAQILHHVADTLKAPRVLLCWRTTDASTMTVVEWTDGRASTSSEDVAMWESAVARELRDSQFLWRRGR